MKQTVRLNIKALENAQNKLNINSDSELAAKIGVSITQIWRAKLPVDDPRHNSPGPQFIAGVLKAFNGRFEDFFFLDKLVR